MNAIRHNVNRYQSRIKTATKSGKITLLIDNKPIQIYQDNFDTLSNYFSYEKFVELQKEAMKYDTKECV